MSIFDPKTSSLRGWGRFMNRVIAHFQKPVAHDGKEHFQYVPTQVVTEYLRSALTGDESLDGVIYSSVKNKGGRCVLDKQVAASGAMTRIPSTARPPARSSPRAPGASPKSLG